MILIYLQNVGKEPETAITERRPIPTKTFSPYFFFLSIHHNARIFSTIFTLEYDRGLQQQSNNRLNLFRLDGA